MSVLNPSIQGISTPSRIGTQYESLSLGNAATFRVDSSNPFYTTKVSNLTISATTYTAGAYPNAGSIVFEFSGSPDLSEVMVGNYLRVNVCGDLENTGDFKITAVNDGADTITVEALHGKTNASATGKAETLPFFGAYSLECLVDTSGLAVSQDGDAGASFPDLVAGQGSLSTFTEVTISTSGLVELKLL